MPSKTEEEVERNLQDMIDGPKHDWLGHADPFNAKPRPIVLLEIGPLSIELGQAQRKCRSCTRAIPMGEYHLAVGYGEGSSSLKICENCLEATAGWCKVANRRNL